jgi:hypothetical protein
MLLVVVGLLCILQTIRLCKQYIATDFEVKASMPGWNHILLATLPEQSL